MKPGVLPYRLAVGLAVGTVVFIGMASGAVGLLGVDGDPADLMYLGVVAVGAVGALGARLRASGMTKTMMAMAGATGVVAVVALAVGLQDSPISSVGEILMVNGFLAALFSTSALLFRSAARAQGIGGHGRDEGR